MRVAILFGVATLIALTIQTSIPLWLPIRSLAPNLIVVLAVDLGMRNHSAAAVAVAFAMGYATDAVAGVHLGLNALLMTVIYFLGYELSSRLLVANVFVASLLVFAGVLFTGLSAVAVDAWANAGDAIFANFSTLTLQALISALLAPLVFRMLSRGRKIVGLPDKAERE